MNRYGRKKSPVCSDKNYRGSAIGQRSVGEVGEVFVTDQRTAETVGVT